MSKVLKWTLYINIVATSNFADLRKTPVMIALFVSAYQYGITLYLLAAPSRVLYFMFACLHEAQTELFSTYRLGCPYNTISWLDCDQFINQTNLMRSSWSLKLHAMQRSRVLQVRIRLGWGTLTRNKNW